MHKTIFVLFVSTSVLICCLGASAKPLVADAVISNETGLTLGLVIAAICFVAWGAWQLKDYIDRQEVKAAKQGERIKALERKLEIEVSDDDE